MHKEVSHHNVLAPDLRENLCVKSVREEVQRTSEILATHDVICYGSVAPKINITSKWCALMETYINICKRDDQCEFAIWHRKLKPGLCDNWEGWDGVGSGRKFQEEGDILYLWLIHVNIWQKPTQYCKYPLIKNKYFFKNRRCTAKKNYVLQKPRFAFLSSF